MKIKLRVALIITIFLTGITLFSQTGNIRGIIKTSDGASAEFVNVGIKGSSKGVTVNKKGEYEIKNIPEGAHIVVASFVGLETKEINVEVKANETTVVPEITLSENAQTLKEVVISGSTNKYNQNTPSSSLRLATPLLEVPQNIQIVTQDALKDQQVLSMSDGLIRNVSGAVRLEHWGDMYTNIVSRGSQVQAFRNGFNVVNSYWGPLTEDMSFVDHIEFVKGPAGFMLSSGDPAGLYNVVTKKPTGITKGEASFTLGSFDLYRTTLDLDGKLTQNGKLLYRLNLSAQNKKSHRANEYNNRYVIAPVISYQLDDKTKLTLEYTYQNAQMSDVGSFYVFSAKGFATLPRNFTTLPAGMPGTNINDHSAYINLEHKINNHWKITGQLSRFIYRQQGSSMWPSSIDSSGNMIRATSSWDAKSTMTMAQIFLNGDFTTGKIRHRVLTGLDMANKQYFADWGQYHELDSIGAEFNVYDPNYGTPVNGYPNFNYSTPLEQRAQAIGGLMDQRYSAVYLQDELGFFENKLRLTLAGRYTSLAVAEWGAAAAKADKFTPRLGLSVSVDKQTSIYALYDQSFIPQNGKMANGSKVNPITGDNMEAGMKRNWFQGKWNTSLSVYRIIKNNELTADPNSPPTSGLSIVVGQKTAQGLEFDLRGQIFRGLNLIANYAYTDSRVSKVADGVTVMKVGDVVPNFAKHTMNSWLNYSLQNGALKGTGISAGFTYLIGRETYWDVSENPEEKIPDYFKLDGGLFWAKDNFKITANVFNILDTYLYSGSYYAWLKAYNWQTEPGRNYRLTVTYKF
ncbi:TonB-dependent siderophore receptor [Sphingobacteriaceae bacterium]|nr:TonB-dependent siderophore receptor [Sphingobacteriaceae bacterium]